MLKPELNGRHLTDGTFKCILLEISLVCDSILLNLFTVELKTKQHWVRLCLRSEMTWYHTGEKHYNDVIMGTMASQITSLTIVYSIVYSGTDQSKHQSSESLAFVRGIYRGPVNFPHKGPVTRKMIPFDDVIINTWDNDGPIKWRLYTLPDIDQFMICFMKFFLDDKNLTVLHIIDVVAADVMEIAYSHHKPNSSTNDILCCQLFAFLFKTHVYPMTPFVVWPLQSYITVT